MNSTSIEGQGRSQLKQVAAVTSNALFRNEMEKFTYFELADCRGDEKFNRKYLAHTVNNETILEITQMQAEQSMFVGDSVSRSTSILNFVDVDPLLLALSFLSNSRGVVSSEKQGYFKQIDDIFDATGCSPALASAMKILQANQRILRNLPKICDVKSHDPDPRLDFFRLNDAKLTEYLTDKMNKAEALFAEKEKYFAFQKLATKDVIPDKVFFGLEYAFNALPTDLFVSLILTPKNFTMGDFNNFKRRRDNAQKFDFYSATENNADELEANQQSSAQKKKKEAATVKTSAADIKNQLAAKGTRSISSFFTKK